MLVRALAASFLFATASLAQTPNSPPRHLVLVRTTGPAQLQQLLALDLDLAACRPPLLAQRRVEAIVNDQELANLRAQGFEVRLLQRDLSAFHAAQAARNALPRGEDLPNPPLGQGAMGGHWTLAQMEAILDALHTQNPSICAAKTSIGMSIENRPIWMVKISDNVGVDEHEPEVLFDALHHAREPLSMEATVVFMEWLVTNYGIDPEATMIVDERELYFVPCLNPDGYEFNFQNNPGGGGMWRKNRRDNGGGSFGVDLNRNYPTAWNAPNGGSSASSTSDTYRGTGPLSEPETQAIEAFAQSRQFVTVFTTHTYQDVLLRPWGWQQGDPANVADYDMLGDYLTVENGVAHGSIASLLYIASGSSVDHHHTARGTITFSAELGRSNEGGFWPSGQAIVDIAERHQPMFKKVALTAGAAFVFADVTVSEASGGNGNGTIEPGETGEVVVTLQNVGLEAAAGSIGLQTVTPSLQIGTSAASLGNLPALGAASNSALPLTFTVPTTITAPSVQLRVVAVGDGRVSERLIDVDLIARRIVLRDDFEVDRGFARAPGGTATTGLFERSAPQLTVNGSTTVQPGAQTTPTGSMCWVTDGRAGSSAGSYDVDGGFTELLSPVLDLAHLHTARAELMLWYAESVGDDAMSIDISRDAGATWSPLYTRSTATNAWLALELDLGAPLTAAMQLRWHAQDLYPSLVELLVDDFAIRGQLPDGSITLLASGAPGSTVQVVMHAPAGELCVPVAALATGAATFPGVQGTLLLDQGSLLVFGFQTAGTDGRAERELSLPAGPGFSGLSFHWQSVTLSPVRVAFGGNRTTLTLR